MGLAGVAQVVRIHRHIQHVRRGKIYKETDEVVFAVTTFTAQEAGPEQLLQLARERWSIENGQHHRRDRTQDGDRTWADRARSFLADTVRLKPTEVRLKPDTTCGLWALPCHVLR